MLSDATLLDVIRWLDRRSMELTLRPVNRLIDKLIRTSTVTDDWPKIYFESLYMCHNDNCIVFKLLARRTSASRREIAARPPPPKPFNAFDARKLPPYLYFNQITITDKKLYTIPAGDLKPYLPVYRHRNFHYVMFSVKSLQWVKSLLPLCEFAWAGSNTTVHSRTFLRNNLRLFDSRLFRTCTRLILSGPLLMHPDHKGSNSWWSAAPRLIGWLTDPSELYPTVIKHMGIGFATQRDTIHFIRGLVDHFKARDEPSAIFHLFLKPTKLIDADLPDIQFNNVLTNQTLRTSFQQWMHLIWCRPTNSSSDFCSDCPYFTVVQSEGRELKWSCSNPYLFDDR